MNRIAFPHISACALSNAADLLRRVAPGGVMRGAEYVVRNPRRDDRTPGSFRVNTQTGRWADFATGDAGGDLISLWAYLQDVDQGTAAIEIATIYGVNAR
jgi:hypothetical protein